MCVEEPLVDTKKWKCSLFLTLNPHFVAYEVQVYVDNHARALLIECDSAAAVQRMVSR